MLAGIFNNFRLVGEFRIATRLAHSAVIKILVLFPDFQLYACFTHFLHFHDKLEKCQKIANLHKNLRRFKAPYPHHEHAILC
jgi:hypothetical protein